MIAQCDECKHWYRNKRTMKEHQRQTGHKQGDIEVNIARLSDVTKLQIELSQKSKLIAKLEDSLKAKDSDFAILHDEIAKLASIDHEDDVVREKLRGLSKEGYVLLGEQLGYDTEAPIADQGETAPVEDSKPVQVAVPATLNEPKSEIFMGKREGPGWKFYNALGFSVKEPISGG